MNEDKALEILAEAFDKAVKEFGEKKLVEAICKQTTTNRFSRAISELQSCSPLLQNECLTDEEKTSRVLLIYTMAETLCEIGVEIDADELKQIVGGLE